MRCFVKVFNKDESLAFKGTFDLGPGQTSMSQVAVNGAGATIEVQARREGDAPDILDDLEKEAQAVGAGSLVDTIRRMRREFNEIPKLGEAPSYLQSEESYRMPDSWQLGQLRINGSPVEYTVDDDGEETTLILADGTSLTLKGVTNGGS